MWAQKTPDDRFAMLFDPQAYVPSGPRFPMAIETSDDGITFRDMRVIHGEVPPQRYQGRAKNTGLQYLRGGAEWAGDAPTLDKSAIWVVYSMNKEDIWVSRIPVPTVPETVEPVHDSFNNLPTVPRVPGWNIYSPIWAPVSISRDASGNGFLQLEDRDPVDYARAIRTFPPSTSVEVSFRVAAGQTNRGRLEIDLLGSNGTRPVQLILNRQGELQAVNGTKITKLGTYQANKWASLAINVRDGRFTLTRHSRPRRWFMPFPSAQANFAIRCHGQSPRTFRIRRSLCRQSAIGLTT
jgi:hypothetical protein